MLNLTLYFAPRTSSRVALIALEQTGAAFEVSLVKMMAGEHKSPAYLALNPSGKVPLLKVDGQPLTENLAILLFLARTYPQADLLPLGRGPLQDALAIADLSWCASTVHPIVTRLRIPGLFCDSPDGCQRVWQLAAEAMAPNFAIIDRRLASQPWLLGKWSLVDAFAFWIWDQARESGFDTAPYRNFADHAQRTLRQDPVRRALQREAEAEALLDSQGLKPRFPPPPGGALPT
jgi:glutathione S-transferase